MKIFLNSIIKALAPILLVALLAACKSATPAVDPGATPMTGLTQSAPTSNDPATSNQSGNAGTNSDTAPTPRPTSPPVAALSDGLPAFQGLYWTGEVSVMPVGENAVRLVSGLPCPDLLDLLAAGEWLVKEQAVPPPAQSGMFSTLARLEKDGQAALIDLKGYVFMDLTIEGEAEATPDPSAAQVFPGCSGTVQMLSEQPIYAAGVEEAEGTAVQYPLAGGCMTFDGQTQVKLFYEGPDDFRASVDFTVPAENGEYTVDEADLSLSIQRAEKSYVQTFSDVYALGAFDGEGVDSLEGTEFYAMSEDAGVVRVTSINPLAGEVEITDFADDYGETQTFRAGFACP